MLSWMDMTPVLSAHNAAGEVPGWRHCLKLKYATLSEDVAESSFKGWKMVNLA